MALIECVLRDGETVIDKERMRYRFKDDGSGCFVCNVNHPAHSAQLLGMGEKAYREVDVLAPIKLVGDRITQDLQKVYPDVQVANEEPEDVNLEDWALSTNINERIRTISAGNPDAKASEIAKMVGVSHQKVTKVLRG